MIGKTISNNVYIQRSNNMHHVVQKEKKVLKKESSSINSSGQLNGSNSDNLAFKFIPPLKKNKSPKSHTATAGSVTEKESRSLKKIVKWVACKKCIIQCFFIKFFVILFFDHDNKIWIRMPGILYVLCNDHKAEYKYL